MQEVHMTLNPRRLQNNMVVFAIERNIRIHDKNSLTWFDQGMLDQRTGCDPSKHVPKHLMETVAYHNFIKNSEAVIETLICIGDWIAGWEFSEFQKVQEQ